MKSPAKILRPLLGAFCRMLVASLWVTPALAQNPPAGRSLPTVCASGTCSGGVNRWAAGGAGAPRLSVNGKTMTIRQLRQRELFNWATFDVAQGHTVEFDQKFGEAALALNRVLGTTNPQSIINGAIKAPGEVYVINQNGIVFGSNARVDVHSLTASTLDLWDIDEFLANDLTYAIRKTDASGNPTPQAAFDHSGAAGNVEVERGAHIGSAEGGRVMLVAPRVRNAGSIESPGGQTVLAGSYDKVYVAASTDENLRGLVVEVDTGGRVDNLGELIAERGNVSMVGLAVNQDGVARASTAVNFNGSIRLAARHKAGPGTIVNNGGNISINTAVLATTPAPGDPLQEAGLVLGANSVTEVVPDASDTTRTIDATAQRPSIVEAVGKTVRLERNARITAPGGAVSIRAVRGTTPGEVSLASGAVIDVAGTDDTVLPMSANVGQIELRGNELADFPAQRDGVLRGSKVNFDMRSLRFVENDPATAEDDQYFLPIGNVTAAVTSQRRGIGERLAAGGTVSIEGDAIDLAAGSLIDFSGGAVTYEAGFLQTSLLISEGRVFDINDADPELVYDAVLPYIDVEYSRWGVTDTFNVFGLTYDRGRFEQGYTVGYDAGSLRIVGSDISLDGALRGGVTRGRLQRDPATARVAGRLRFANEIPLAGLFELGQIVLQTGLPDGPNGIRLGRAAPGETDLALTLPARLFDDGGINRVRVISTGAVRIGDFALAAGGLLEATANGESLIDGAVSLPAGDVSLATIQAPTLRPGLSVSGTVDVSGGWVNDLPLLNPDGPQAPVYIDGGTVTLTAAGDVTLAAGSRVDVSGGARVRDDGSVEAGAAGAITITSQPDSVEFTGTRLVLDGELRGYGLADGGTLSLAASAFRIGAASVDPDLPGLDLAADFFGRGGFTRYRLAARSSADGTDSTLVDFAAGTRVDLRAENYLLGDGYTTAPTATPLDDLVTLARLPRELRPSTSLTVTTNRDQFSVADAIPSLTVGDGAIIATEIGGDISFTARDRIVVAGALRAPAGAITLNLAEPGGNVGFRNEGIWLLDGAELDARGADRTYLDNDGLRRGDVLAGGTITLDAVRGSVVLAPRSLLDVSGIDGMVEVFGTAGATPAVLQLAVPSAAGVIDIAASEAILPYGALRGFAGGAGAASGTLGFALDLSARESNLTFAGTPSDRFPEDARVLSLGTRPDWDPTWADLGSAAFVSALRTSGVTDADTLDTTLGVHGIGLVDPAEVVAGGFGALALRARQSNGTRADGVSRDFTLPAEVRLSGDVELSLARGLSIDAPILSSAGGHARLDAPYVMLGSSNNTFRVSAVDRRNLFEPRGGSGSLAVSADLIDLVGFMSLRGFGNVDGSHAGSAPVRLSASGDLRLHGLPVPVLNSNAQSRLPEIQGGFETAADLELSAAQVYPTTLSEFTVAVRGEDGTLTVRGDGSAPPAPLSAGGNLTLAARNVEQDGVVRVPLGQLHLLAGAQDATAIARAQAAATEASPYDGARVVQAIVGSVNAGRAAVRGSVISTGALVDSDYRLDYLGANQYRLTRLDDGHVTNIDTGGSNLFTTTTIDGIRLTLSDTSRASPGDTFFIRHGDDPLLGDLHLGAGSLTSVAGAGLAVPLGEILLEDNWILSINGVTRTLDEPRLFESNPSPAALARRPFNAPDRPWTKRIDLRGADVRLAAAATLDLSGGGDVIAAEFRPGPGGSQDLLFDGDGRLAFALVPAMGAAARPLDPFLAFDDGVLASSLSAQLPAVPLDELQLTVEVGAGSSLPAGRYRVLPRAYALLPGAYLVTPDSSVIDFPADGAVLGSDGVPVVAARFGDAAGGSLQQRPIGLRVETREQAFDRAEYLLATGDDFFGARAVARDQLAPQLPRDGGRLVINATDALRLEGSLAPNRGAGRSSQVDIVADHIAVVNRVTGASDRVEVLARDLNDLGAESLLLGGSRAFSEAAFQLDLQADTVSVARGVTLHMPEILLGARDLVEIDGTLRAEGPVVGLPTLTFASDGGVPRSRALVRVSSDAQVDLVGDPASGGVVRVNSGAALRAPGSITIDGSSDVFIDGTLAATGGSVSLNTSLISVGAVPGGTGGLVLGSLDDFGARALRLASASTIDFYGTVSTATRFDELVLDSAGLRGFGAGTRSIGAALLTLRNSGAGAAPTPGSGNGTLALSAGRIEIGAGDLALTGFAASRLTAPVIAAVGEATLNVAGDLVLATPLLTGDGRLDVEAAGDISVLSSASTAARYSGHGATFSKTPLADAVLGGRIALTAAALVIDSDIVLPSGQFVGVAQGGDVTLRGGAVIDVAGQREQFATRVVGTEGGTARLEAQSGDVRLLPGSVVDVGGIALNATAGTNAGSLSLRAPSGAVDFGHGELFGGAWRAGGSGLAVATLDDAQAVTRGGHVTLDIGVLPSPLVVPSGFAGSIAVRYRGAGDVSLASFSAGKLAFAVDRGGLTVNGTLDARAADGGIISLVAADDVVLNGQLLASANVRAGDGGRVELETRSGRITLAAGAVVDVAGRNAAGQANDSGRVRIVAPRGGDNASVAVDPLLASIRGARTVEVVANRVYDGISRIEATETASPTQIGLDTLRAHNDGFAAAVPGLVSLLDPADALGARLAVMPGIEIRSAAGSDLELASDWALGDWRAAGKPGLLTLRSGRDLALNGNLDDGIGRRHNVFALPALAGDPSELGSDALTDTLLEGDSWSYRLVAGADFSSVSGSAGAVPSADVLAVREDRAGDVLLADNHFVRTGTGSIDIAAAGDLQYLGDQAALYTVGRYAGYGNIAFDADEYDAFGNFWAFWLAFQAAPISQFFGGGTFDYGNQLPVSGAELDAMFADFDIDAAEEAVLRPVIEAMPFFFDTYLPGAVFGDGGGDITVSVGGDVVGAGSAQLNTDWLVVFGGETGDTPLIRSGAAPLTLPTFWAVRPALFRQNLGTLGGGDIDIRAGGDVSNLSVVLPTTGRPDGSGFSYGPLSNAFVASGTNRVTELGGGDLTLNVGGDLGSARLMLARGDAVVRAGGDVGAASGSTVDTLLALGHSHVDIGAAGDVTVEAAYDYGAQRRPLVVTPAFNGRFDGGGAALAASTRTYFFSYGSGSEIDLTSLGGDVTLENSTRASDPLFTQLLGTGAATPADTSILRIYPGTLRARALGGDVVIARGFQLFPDAVGSLELLADGNITDLGVDASGARQSVVQSDADPALLPSALVPAALVPGLGSTFAPLKQRPVNDDQRSWHALLPVHGGDAEPSLLVARDGTIGQARTESRGFRLFLAEPADIDAGRDIINLDFEIQHLDDNDVSVVQAGRDFRFTPNRNSAGNLAQRVEDRFQGALFTGPGRGVVLAGRDIDLGTSDGIVSAGNLRNFALADHGADLQVFAGAGAGPDLAAFFAAYLRDLPEDAASGFAYLRALVGTTLAASEVEAMYGELDAWRDTLVAGGIDITAPGIRTDLGTPLAAALLARFFDELERAGVHATTTGSDDYSRGYAAIDTLWPAADRAGQLSLLLSRIHTEDGGDIDMFVPGGGANAGAAATDAVTKDENQLGVVVQDAGSVHGFVRDDFLVNASRVFALQGGDILLWSTAGDIDAGRGAKTALAAPPPQVVFDPAVGQFVTVFPPEVSGSGIRNFAPPGVTPGDVFLFAPQGVISAGDAGIASAGNITIGAREVIGADNIEVGGTAVGVPTANIGLAAGLTGVSNVANAASRDAQDSAAADAADSAAAANVFDQASLSIISVEVLGFGG